MKSCGCTKTLSKYPCGHIRSTWEYCMKAKARNLLKRTPPEPCDAYQTVTAPPDLENTCGFVCLTKPFLCSNCSAVKQVGWRCSRCHTLRDRHTLVWDVCACRKHKCGALAVGLSGVALCDPCKRNACEPPSERAPSVVTVERPPGDVVVPELSWRCHHCARPNRTPADAMRCFQGCGHARCGQCRALFRCNCECGCLFRFVEGGEKPCDWCVESCGKKN
ncbi:hypothetical protein GGR54DRAFT_650434 [Hypoxylon sp. NC1633]|nr:hypothetical protein GGR54DRAFT_650434 [Hypoxylon sp. NC1633]